MIYGTAMLLLHCVQENLGHYSAAFTLDTYAHVTDQMKRETANKMEQYIARVQNA